jgi:PleD family two-component response regulator
VLLYDPDPNHLQALIKKMRQRVAVLNIAKGEDSDSGVLAITVGAAISPVVDGHDIERILKVAEDALDQAKDAQNHGVAVLSVSGGGGDSAVTSGPWGSRAASSTKR